jgi:hypothetical protein
MSSPIIVPFNFQPVLSFAQGTTYTVPAGKYARITPTRTGSGVLVDSIVLLPPTVVVATGSTIGIVFTNNTNCSLWGFISASAGLTFRVVATDSSIIKNPYSGTDMTVTSANATVFMPIGARLQSSGSGTWRYELQPFEVPNIDPFFADEGQIIQCDNFYVELYNKIS